MTMRNGLLLLAAWLAFSPTQASAQGLYNRNLIDDRYQMGLNYPWKNYGTDFGTGGWGNLTNWDHITSDFQNMSKAGVRVVRWFVFADGRYSPEFNKTSGLVTGLDSYFLTNIDQALKIAADNDIRLHLVLVDAALMWTSEATLNGGVQQGGHEAMVTNPATLQSYLDNALKPLLQHITASGKSDLVFAYEIVNEPESQIDPKSGPNKNVPVGWGGDNLPLSQVQSFVEECASYVKTYGGGALCTVGSATPEFTKNWKGLGLDFYQFHYYPWADPAGHPGAGLPHYSELGLDRPCIVGEFATKWPGLSYVWDDMTPLSAYWYLETIHAYGYAGAFPWSCLKSGTKDPSDWPDFEPIYTAWTWAFNHLIPPGFPQP